MKLIFLGTGHGVPAPDRHCSATMFEVGGKRYLIDGGAPVVDIMRARGIPVDGLSAVFVTHRHSDHTFGLAMLINITTWYYKKADYDIYLPEQACIDAFRAMLRSSLDSTADDRVRMHVFAAGEVYSDDTITVRAIRTNHMNGIHPSYAFVIDCTGDAAGEDKGKRIIFTGDLHQGDAADFPQIILDEECDALVSELVHFKPDVIIPRFEACPAKRIIVNHYTDQKSDPPELDIKLRAEVTSKPICLARDGDEFLI